MKSSKKSLARLYHSHHNNYCEDIPFWQSLAQKQGNPILELGCGTGRVLVPLAKSGFIVYGIDHSAGMLSFLRNQITPSLIPDSHIIEGDITDFMIPTKFRLIIFPCNTYSTFDASSRKAMLGCVYDHLMPDGIFAVSMPNPILLNLAKDADSGPEIESIFNHPETGYPVQVSSQWERKTEKLTFIWHYDHLLPDATNWNLKTNTNQIFYQPAL